MFTSVSRGSPSTLEEIGMNQREVRPEGEDLEDRVGRTALVAIDRQVSGDPCDFSSCLRIGSCLCCTGTVIAAIIILSIYIKLPDGAFVPD